MLGVCRLLYNVSNNTDIATDVHTTIDIRVRMSVAECLSIVKNHNIFLLAEKFDKMKQKLKHYIYIVIYRCRHTLQQTYVQQ